MTSPAICACVIITCWWLTAINADSSPCIVKASGGNTNERNCSLPFMYNGKMYRKCTLEKSQGKKLWCSTTFNFDRDGRWGYCHIDNVVTVNGTGGGRPCVFPFTYRNVSYETCTSAGTSVDQPWCAVSFNYDADGLWGYCVIHACTSAHVPQPPVTTRLPTTTTTLGILTRHPTVRTTRPFVTPLVGSGPMITPTSPPPAPSKGLSTAVVIAIVAILCVLVLVLIIAAGICICRRGRRKKTKPPPAPLPEFVWSKGTPVPPDNEVIYQNEVNASRHAQGASGASKEPAETFYLSEASEGPDHVQSLQSTSGYRSAAKVDKNYESPPHY